MAVRSYARAVMTNLTIHLDRETSEDMASVDMIRKKEPKWRVEMPSSTEGGA